MPYRTGPELFDLEMKYLFEGNWIYLAHESQLSENGDYLTTWMGKSAHRAGSR